MGRGTPALDATVTFRLRPQSSAPRLFVGPTAEGRSGSKLRVRCSSSERSHLAAKLTHATRSRTTEVGRRRPSELDLSLLQSAAASVLRTRIVTEPSKSEGSSQPQFGSIAAISGPDSSPDPRAVAYKSTLLLHAISYAYGGSDVSPASSRSRSAPSTPCATSPSELLASSSRVRLAVHRLCSPPRPVEARAEDACQRRR